MNNDVLYIEAYYHGGMTGFEIIPRDAHFAIAKDGNIIATIKIIMMAGSKYLVINCRMKFCIPFTSR